MEKREVTTLAQGVKNLPEPVGEGKMDVLFLVDQAAAAVQAHQAFAHEPVLDRALSRLGGEARFGVMVLKPTRGRFAVRAVRFPGNLTTWTTSSGELTNVLLEDATVDETAVVTCSNMADVFERLGDVGFRSDAHKAVLLFSDLLDEQELPGLGERFCAVSVDTALWCPSKAPSRKLDVPKPVYFLAGFVALILLIAILGKALQSPATPAEPPHLPTPVNEVADQPGPSADEVPEQPGPFVPVPDTTPEAAPMEATPEQAQAILRADAPEPRRLVVPFAPDTTFNDVLNMYPLDNTHQRTVLFSILKNQNRGGLTMNQVKALSPTDDLPVAQMALPNLAGMLLERTADDPEEEDLSRMVNLSQMLTGEPIKDLTLHLTFRRVVPGAERREP